MPIQDTDSGHPVCDDLYTVEVGKIVEVTTREQSLRRTCSLARSSMAIASSLVTAYDDRLVRQRK